MKYFYYSLSLLLFVIGQVSYAQMPTNSPSNTVTDLATTSVKGKVMDSSNSEALPYATATVYNNEGAIIDGTITDDNGKFKLNLKPGTYTIKIEFISYKDVSIPITVKKGTAPINLGIIKLEADHAVFSELVLEETANQLVLERDKKVFNVGADKSQAGNSALEVMNELPSVEVDAEGSVNMRGNANVRILIDGKPSAMLGSSNDGLKNIPAELIDKIEIITNPSSKYEADSEAGIINIILKKNKKIGFNGNIQTSIGNPESGSLGINLAYRDKKWNFHGGYSVRHSDVSIDTYGEKKTFSGDSTLLHTKTDRTNARLRDSHSFNFGTDFYLNQKTTIGISTNISLYDVERNTGLNYNNLIPEANSTIRNQLEEEDGNSMDLNLYLTHKFKKKDHELSIDLQKSKRDHAEIALTDEYIDEEEAPFYLLEEQLENDQISDNGLFKLDYSYPFDEDKMLELGVRLDDRNIDFDNEQTIVDLENNTVRDLGYDMLYKEQISASYLSWSHKLNDKYSYSLGLRAENSDISVDYTSIDQSDVNEKEYTGFFPSANFNYQKNKKESWQLGVTRKIRRPRYHELMPFFSTSNNQDIFGGNPDIDPSYSTNMELQYLRYSKGGSFTAAVFTNLRTDVIQRLSTIDLETGNTHTKPENAADRQDIGMEFFYSSKLTKWLSIRASLSSYYYKLTAYESFDLEDRDDISHRFSLSNNFNLPKKWKFQARYSFRSARENLQGKSDAMHSMDLSLNKDLGKEKNWTFSARLSDAFNSRKRQMTTETEEYYLYQEMRWRARTLTCSLSYRFNQAKKRGGPSGAGGGEEMMF